MKKIFSIFAASLMLFAASCSTEKLDEPTGDGNVTFTVQLPGGLQSRALGDGTTATKLYVAAYEAGTTAPLAVANGAQSIADMSSLKATVSLQLVTGKTYDLVFWAQAADAPYAFNPTGRTVDMNYSGAAANAENRDAFFHIENGLTVAGPMEKDITLKRPFAQLNFVTADYQAAKAGGIDATTTSVKVKNLKPTLSLVDGKATGTAAEVTFTTAARPTETMTINSTSYDYLAMNYLLIDDTRDVVECEMTAYDAAEANDTRVLTVSSVPVQRNYRTNIYGNLLTSTTTFNVEIKPNFDGEHNGESPDFFAIGANGQYFSTIGEAMASLPAEGTAEQNVITLGAGEFSLPSTIDRNLTFEAAGSSRAATLTGTKLKFTGTTTASGKDLVIKGITVECSNVTYQSGFQHSNSVSFKDCVINGNYFGYATTISFDGCVFNGAENLYSYWTWGNTDATFKNCRFNADGKAILVYSENRALNVTVDGCTFTTNNDRGKGAVEIHTESGVRGTLTINNSTATGFKTAGLWQELNNGTGVATHNFTTTVDGKAYYLNGVQTADSEGFYGIDSPVGLQQAARFVFPGRKYKVLADLDMTGINYPYVNVDGGESLVIEGGNKTISNLIMENKSIAALISRVGGTGVQISNLTIANSKFIGNNLEDCTADVTGAQGCAGAFIGWLECHTLATSGSLTNCHVKGNTYDKAKYCGGLVGYQTAGQINMSNCSATDCTYNTAYCDLGKEGQYKGHLGGLIGLFSSGTITNATATNLTITGATYDNQGNNMRFGALIGTGYSSASVTTATVKNCTVNGTAVTTNTQLIGLNNGVSFSGISFE